MGCLLDALERGYRLRPRPPGVSIRLSGLATILRDLGDPAARPLAERALATGTALQVGCVRLSAATCSAECQLHRARFGSPCQNLPSFVSAPAPSALLEG